MGARNGESAVLVSLPKLKPSRRKGYGAVYRMLRIHVGNLVPLIKAKASTLRIASIPSRDCVIYDPNALRCLLISVTVQCLHPHDLQS